MDEINTWMNLYATPPPNSTQQTQFTPPPQPMQPTQEQQFNEDGTPLRQPRAVNRYGWPTPEDPPACRGRRR